MAVILVTWSRLQSPDYLPDFLEYADRAYDRSKQASGNISSTEVIHSLP